MSVFERTSKGAGGGTMVADQKSSSNSSNSNATANQQGNSEQTAMQKIMSFSIESGPKTKDILHFTTQLSVMVRAGISLQEALDSVASQVEKKKFKVILIDLKNRIEGGQSFSQALAEHPKVFSNLYINMVAAAEISGSLSMMLDRLVDYLADEAETRSQVIGAMVYPIIIATMAVTCVTFLLLFVLPRFLTVFAGKEHLLPITTKSIMAASNFMRNWWYIFFPGVGASIWGFCYFTKTKAGRLWWDKAKLRIPLLRTLFRSLYITRGLHTMGVLSNSGVPILDTIAITAQISGNVYYERMWWGVHEAVRQGKKIANSLDEYKLLPSSVVQMIRSGEDSGTLGDVLRDVAEFYAKELKTVIKAVTSMIEPLMIVVMGVLVGFIAASIILPIFKMSSLVSGH